MSPARSPFVVLLLLAVATPAVGQDLAAVCRPVERPVVGGWARYRLRGTDDSTEMRMALVAAVVWGGADHVWQESLLPTPDGETVIQTLVPAEPYDPTTIRRAIVRPPGQEAMELPASALAAARGRGAQASVGPDACRSGEPVGWETLEVPAGRLRAMHVRYVRGGRAADVWLAPGVPFAVVRSIISSGLEARPLELVLVGHGRDAIPTIPLPQAGRP